MKTGNASSGRIWRIGLKKKIILLVNVEFLNCQSLVSVATHEIGHLIGTLMKETQSYDPLKT